MYILQYVRLKKAKPTLVQALRLCTGRTAHRGCRGIALPFLDHCTRRGWGVSATTLPVSPPQEITGTHCTGGWVGTRAGLDRCGKSRPPPGFDPRTVQPVASLYTDYATRPTLQYVHMKFKNLAVDRITQPGGQRVWLPCFKRLHTNSVLSFTRKSILITSNGKIR